ncbi:hypothetical protein [Fretibacterium fastidiosum]|uniref:hypothetical protein n=1 Tax=Fretibacterium fastidiosum TaxID=651822 RepID=UPI0002FEEE21|nr:hypothetical protein [Fretibacterium fastidiosum]
MRVTSPAPAGTSARWARSASPFRRTASTGAPTSAGGLALGFAFAGAALWLWNAHKDEFFVDGTEPRGDDRTHVEAPGEAQAPDDREAP